MAIDNLTVWVLSALVVVIILVIAISAHSRSKQQVSKTGSGRGQRENNSQCSGSFPAQPSTMPDSTYSQLVQPYIETSSANMTSKPTVTLDSNAEVVVNDKFMCNTPSDLYCVNNDLCSRYGIGEACVGQEGYSRCVCEIDKKTGLIGHGAVCTQNSQCCTSHCKGAPGLFSKFCECPDGSAWSERDGQCIPLTSDPVYRPIMPPKGACLDKNGVTVQGNVCSNDSDCGLGASCVPDGYCNCQLSTQKDYMENMIKLGGICNRSDQCMPNLTCAINQQGNRTCLCPTGLIWDWSTSYCVCPGAGDVYDSDSQKCYPASNVPRKICPSKGGSCKNDQDVGLGEACDPISRVAVCFANDLPHTSLIYEGGKCTMNEQCVSGTCAQNSNGLSYCKGSAYRNFGAYSRV